MRLSLDLENASDVSAFSSGINGSALFTFNTAATFDATVQPCGCAACSGFAVDDRAAPFAQTGYGQPQYGLNAAERGETGPNSKPSYTIDEAAAQLTRSNSTWNGTGALGQAATVTYAFRDTAPATMPNGTAGYSAFNAQQIAQAELSLQSWSDVANIRFTRVGSGTTGTGAYSEDAQMLFGNYSSGASGAAAFAYFPGGGNTSVGGDSWYNVSQSSNANPAYLNYGRLTITHEIGHAIGLSHPADYNAGSGGTISYNGSAVYYEDSKQYSLMSYFSETNTGASYGGYSPAAPMLDDIAAAQRLYGANMTTRAGDSTYGFNSNTGRDFYSTSAAGTPVIFAVWDAGGYDTFDFSGYTQAQRIDLNAGNFSDVSGLRGNVAVAQGVVIERALGGSGVDTVIGNAAANVLQGNGGNDDLDGGAGDDTLRGGTDNDVLKGGAGSDRLFGDEGRDTTTGGAGADLFAYDGSGVSTAAARDVITDFTRGEDKIDLLAAGGSRFVAGAAFGGVAGEVRAFQSGSVTLVELDRNGDRAADLQIELTGLLTLADTDFVGLGGTVTPPPPPPPVTTLTGTAGNDRLTGTSSITRIEGLAGDDVLLAGTAAQAVILDGGDGLDTLDGGSFNDVLLGGAGADRLTGAGGVDRLTGGAGGDMFLFTAAGHSTVGARDVVTDFAAGEDRIDLDAAGGRRFVGAGAFFGTVGEVRAVAANGVTLVEVDTDGDRDADVQIELTGAVALTAANFTDLRSSTLNKPAGQVNSTQASAVSLNGQWSLAADPNIANATTIPHATVQATASGQAEWYKFTVAQAGRVTLDIDGASFDTEIYLQNSAGRLLASNDDASTVDAGSRASSNGRTLDSGLAFDVTAPGEYFIRVERYNSNVTTSGGTYTLHVSAAAAGQAAPAAQAADAFSGFVADELTSQTLDFDTAVRVGHHGVASGELWDEFSSASHLGPIDRVSVAFADRFGGSYASFVGDSPDDIHLSVFRSMIAGEYLA